MRARHRSSLSGFPVQSGIMSWERDSRRPWLERVQQGREIVYRRWRSQGGSIETPVLARAVDDLFGLVLLVKYVQRHDPLALSTLDALPCRGGITVRELAGAIREAARSPVLRAVFDPESFDDDVPLSDGATLSVAEAWVSNRSFPLAAFGDFHQLCLAAPLDEPPQPRRRRSGARRSGGVHYTPAILVDYLTTSTLDVLRTGPIVPSHAPRVLDPSCGSGAFLVAAWRRLALHPDADAGIAANSHQWRLDLLGEAIFGTDIDSRAVVWARRALLLAAWESLAGTDDSTLRVPDLRQTVTCADFLAEPPAVRSDFDAILGGPPFVRYSQIKKDAPDRIAEWRQRFRTARAGQFDLYMPFFEQALRVLRPGGWLGWSTSNTFLRSSTGRELRSLLGEFCSVAELVEFEHRKLYPDAVTQIVLIRMRKAVEDAGCRYVRVRSGVDPASILAFLGDPNASHPVGVECRSLSPAACRGPTWRLAPGADEAVSSAMSAANYTLARAGVRITQGVVTGADDLFLLRSVQESDGGLARVRSRDGGQHLIEAALLRAIVRTRDIRSFGIPEPRTLALVPYDHEGRVLPEAELASRYPRAYAYLLTHRSRLSAHATGKRPWYGFRSDAFLRLPRGPRILLGMATAGGSASLDPEGAWLCHAGVLALTNPPPGIGPEGLLGVLNSRVFTAFIRSSMPTLGEGRHVVRRTGLRSFALPSAGERDDLWREIAETVRVLLRPVLESGEREAHTACLDRLVAAMYDPVVAIISVT